MELIAQKGKWLTQANLENETDRDFYKRIHLAHSLTAEDFVQWTDAAKARWEDEHPQEQLND